MLLLSTHRFSSPFLLFFFFFFAIAFATCSFDAFSSDTDSFLRCLREHYRPLLLSACRGARFWNPSLFSSWTLTKQGFETRFFSNISDSREFLSVVFFFFAPKSKPRCSLLRGGVFVLFARFSRGVARTRSPG